MAAKAIRQITEAFPAPGRLAAPLRPNFHSVSRLVRLHEPRHSGKFGNARYVKRNGALLARKEAGEAGRIRFARGAPVWWDVPARRFALFKSEGWVFWFGLS